MTISMIAAMAQNRVIGRNNDLPWHLPDDFQYFKSTTAGHYVIMGRRNFESLPQKFRPLPGRPNVVISRNPDYEATGAEVVTSLEEAIALARQNGETEAFIIGGGEIYRLGLGICDRIYLTEIHGEVAGDTHFPEMDLTLWKSVSRVHHPADARHAYAFDFVIYEKK